MSGSRSNSATTRLDALEEQLELLQNLQDQFATLQTRYDNLHEENTTMQARLAEIRQAEHLSPTPSSSEHRSPEPKVAAPEYYSGQRSKLRTFLTQVTLVVNSQTRRYDTEQSKVLYAGSYLRDVAFQWFQPYVTLDPQPAFMSDFRLFCQEMTKTFGDPDEKGTATRQLFALRQRSSAASYVADFRRFSTLLDWDNDALCAQFYRGLKDNVKDELARVGKPEMLQDLIDTAIRIDTRHFERTLERGDRSSRTGPQGLFSPNQNRASTESEHKPFHLRATETTTKKGRLTPDEYKRRMDNKLCLYCGSDKHFVRQCRDAPQRQAFQARQRPATQLRGVIADHLGEGAQLDPEELPEDYALKV